MESENKTRNYGLDVIKGICIILVVLVHTVQLDKIPTIVSQICFGVFLNLFFIVSGYLIAEKEMHGRLPYSLLISNKFFSLLIPYIAFSMMTIIWHIIICVGFHNTHVSDTYTEWKIIERDLFCMFSGIGIGTLWFLPILFVSFSFCLLFIYLSEKIHINKYIFLSCVVLFFALLSIVFQSIHFSTDTLVGKIGDEYTNTIYRICYATEYTVLGYCFNMFFNKIILLSKKLVCLFLASFIIIDCVVYKYQNNILFSLFTTIILFTIVMCLFAQGKKEIIFSFLGRNSLSIMVYHYLFLLPIEKIVFSGWILFIVNLFTTILVICILDQFKWHKTVLGKDKNLIKRLGVKFNKKMIPGTN